jgi:cytochrome b involved in lipid metabolism
VPSLPTRVHVLRVCQTAHYDQLCERQRSSFGKADSCEGGQTAAWGGGALQDQMCTMHLETHVETQFTPADVRAHNKATDCWITVKGRVYDVTPWLASHPGGPDIVLLYAGDDATDVFTAFHHTREYVPSVHASLPQCPRIPTAPSTQVPRCWATCRRGASDLGPLRHAYGGGICVPHDAASDSRYYPVGREGRAGM